MKNKNISNEKMKIILEEISSPDGKYFGGVTAYLCAEFALALLEKLNFRIARKNDENSLTEYAPPFSTCLGAVACQLYHRGRNATRSLSPCLLSKP